MDDDWSLIGLCVGAGYLAAAWLCAGDAQRAPDDENRAGWWMLAAVCLALGLNKQADLHVFAIRWLREEIGPVMWRARHVQFREAVTAAVAVAALAVTALAWRTFARWTLPLQVAFAGLACLSAFIVAKLSWTHAGAWIHRATGLSVAHALEIVGLSLILGGAIAAARRPSP